MSFEYGWWVGRQFIRQVCTKVRNRGWWLSQGGLHGSRGIQGRVAQCGETQRNCNEKSRQTNSYNGADRAWD